MSANLGRSAVATGLERSVFIPVPEKGSAKGCSHCCSAVLISHASRGVLRTLPRQHSAVHGPRISTCTGWVLKRQRNQRSNCQHLLDGGESKGVPEKLTSASLTMLKPLPMWITSNWKILKEVGIPDHLAYLLKNLYAGQEATVRTRRGTTIWF